ncbi:AfsR/SARP family transcriptional regulator [Streptomyces sp. NPDC002776]
MARAPRPRCRYPVRSAGCRWPSGSARRPGATGIRTGAQLPRGCASYGLLTAVYASGRAAEALRRFETVGRTLAEEVGTDPGPELRRVHESILRHDVFGAPGPDPTPWASASGTALAHTLY